MLLVDRIILLLVAMSSYDVPAFLYCSADMMNNVLKKNCQENNTSLCVTVFFLFKIKRQ